MRMIEVRREMGAMRTIVISDIHGYARTFEALLLHVNYDPAGDKLFLLGDYVDGGPASLQVIRQVQQLIQNPNVQALGGNHDDMFLNWLDRNDYRLFPYTLPKNGGRQTIRSFCSWYQSKEDDEAAREQIIQDYEGEIQFLRGLPDYLEDERHIYVHAGIDPQQSNWKQTTRKDFRWIRGKFHHFQGKLPVAKTIIFGHEVCARLHQDEGNFTPWIKEQRIGIDGGIKFGKYLNALLINEDGEYDWRGLSSRDAM
ncbi:serine/threonine protein phosphatase [Paenibacillaceae bacterium]|nr:serine/threonine protein phosphatase [Paenibacillaceae bacterium]